MLFIPAFCAEEQSGELDDISITSFGEPIEIDMDYYQLVPITIMNNGKKTHRLKISAINPYSDIYLSFISESPDKEYMGFAPGDKKTLVLSINAQDAASSTYNIIIDLIDKQTGQEKSFPLNISVRYSNLSFAFKDVTGPVDAQSDSKRFFVKNVGDDAPDIDVIAGDDIAGKVIIQRVPRDPSMSIAKGEGVDVTISPLLSDQNRAIYGNVIAKWGNNSRSYPVEFRCDGDILARTLTDPILYFNLKRSGCINKGTVNDLFYLPSGIKKEDVDYAYVDFELFPHSNQYKEYAVVVDFNGRELGKFVLAPLQDGVFQRHIRLDVTKHLNFSSSNSPNANKVHLSTDMDRGYYTPLSDARAVVCLKGEYHHYMCSNRSASHLPPYIYFNPEIAKSGSKLDLTIDSPVKGSTLDTSDFIVVSVRCNGTNVPFCRVSARSNLSKDVISLFDNGQNKDGAADDGIYGAPIGKSPAGSCHLSINAYLGGVSGQNETDFIVTRKYYPPDCPNLKLVDPVLSIDNQTLVGDRAIIIEPSVLHSISLHSSFENPCYISDGILNSNIGIKSCGQSISLDGFIRILNSSGEKNLDITLNSEVSFLDDPAVYGLNTLEFSAKPKEDEHFIQPDTISASVFLTPYKIQSHGVDPILYRPWRENANNGHGNVTIICSPEYEQHLAYNSSKDPSVTSFIAYLQLLGLTELAKKYPDAEVIIIPFRVGDSQDNICAAIERYVQQARDLAKVPLIVGAVPHVYVSYSPSNIIASQSYRAAYMSYAQASEINSMTFWDDLSSPKRALVSSDFRSEKIASPAAKKYKKYNLDDSIDYPLLLLCKKDMPLLQIGPEIMAVDLRTQSAFKSIYSIQRISPLVPIDHTFYLGGSANVGPFSISLNPSSLTISAGYKKVSGLIIVGDYSGIKAKPCLLTYYCKNLSLNDAMNNSVVTQFISPADLGRLDKSVSEIFKKSSITYKKWLSDYVEPDSTFSMLRACTENVLSFDQPVYDSVESIRDSYPASTKEANAIFAGVSILSDVSQIAGYAGLPVSLTASNVPEVLTYVNRDNDINYILLNESANRIEAVQSDFLIPESSMIGDIRMSSVRKQAMSASSSGEMRKLLEQIASGGIPMNTGTMSKSLQKGLASSAKSMNLYSNSQDLATFSSKELYYLGNPDLGDSRSQKKTVSGRLSYDDPEDSYEPKYLPDRFSVNIKSLPERFELPGKTIIYANITENETNVDGFKVRAYSTIAATGTGLPPIPFICMILNSPSSQVVDRIDVASGDSVFLKASLPLTIAQAHDKPLSGFSPDGIWPPQPWSYTSGISGNSSNTIICLYPFKYNSSREDGWYNCTLNISVSMRNLTEENRTTLRLESYPESIALSPSACFPLKVRVFNDISSIGNASDVIIRARASDGINISSDEAQRNSDGSLQWPIMNFGRSATDYNAFLPLNVCIENNTSPDTAQHLINITSEYMDDDVLRNATISIPIVQISPDSVDLAISDVTLKNDTIGENNRYWVDASIENAGKETIIMAQVMLFVDGICKAQESIPVIESGHEQNISLLFRPAFGRHNLSVAVAASPFEVNLQNNYRSLKDIYFKPVEQWIGPSGANVSAVVQSMLKGDGGFIVLGVSQPENSSTSRTVLMNISGNGSIVWERELPQGNFTGYTMLKSGDDYIVAGSNIMNDLQGEELFATKCNSNGIEKAGANWSFGKYSRERALSVCDTADGGFLLTGYGMKTKAKSGILLIKARPGFPGDYKEWDRLIGIDNKNGLGKSVEECRDGSIIIAGSAGSQSGNDTDLLLLNADFNLNPKSLQIWNKTFGGGRDDFALKVTHDQDGGYVILGGTSSFGNGGNDVWLLKTDADGREMWNRTYGGIGDDGAGSLIKTVDGGYLISGYAGMSDRCTKPWIIKTDAHGFEEWNLTFNETGKATSALELDDGSFVVAGYSESCERFPSNQTTVWIRKLRPVIADG